MHALPIRKVADIVNFKDKGNEMITVVVGIVVLALLVGWRKWDAFLSFTTVSVGIGLGLGMDIELIAKSIQKGLGDTLGFLVIILGFGAMLGKLVAETGAAQRISQSFIAYFPRKYIRWAVVLTGFIVGIPMFYSVGFVILVPLVFTVASMTRLPLLYVGLPMLAALSVTHGYLPPHPAPTGIVNIYGADLGKTLIYGLIVAIPAIVLGGPVFSSTLKKYNPQPLQSMVSSKVFEENEMPGIVNSVLTALSPVLLLLAGSLIKTLGIESVWWSRLLGFLTEPSMAMLLSILIATYSLGISRNIPMTQISSIYKQAIEGVALVLLIIAGAGALKAVLVEGAIDQKIGSMLAGLDISPLVLAWGIAAIIRISVGSATVAGLTGAGIIFPLIGITGVDPNLMVLATGAGSLMFSHVNDGGFWLFKEFFNMSIYDTLKTWSVMETIVSVTGLLGVLVLDLLL